MKKEICKEEAPSEEFRFGKAFQIIANRFRRLGDEHLAEEGITFSQLRILAYVARNGKAGEVFQKDLEDAFEIRRSSVTSILQNMEKSGILAREGSEKDARIKKIILTKKGKELDENLKSYIHSLEEDMLLGFSREERRTFQGTLLRVLENLEKIERNSL